MTIADFVMLLHSYLVKEDTWERIDGITYDGDPDSFKVDLAWSDEDDNEIFVLYSVYLCSNGEVCWELHSEDKIYAISTIVCKDVVDIEWAWKQICRNRNS